MKKKILIPATLLILIFGLAVFFLANKNSSVKSEIVENVSGNKASDINLQKENKFLFVPYWTIDNKIESLGYDKLVYFGITIDNEGIDKNDAGYQNINKFISYSEINIGKMLAVRILNQELGSLVLKKQKFQEQIIEESINIAGKNSFKGIVLDFEINGIPFESFTKSISDFYTAYYKSCKKNRLDYYITLYGDSFYRLRPYDVKTLAQNSDGVLIMAYDLHKAGGDPGPNFPLSGKEVFGYDFKTMIDDFLKIVPKEKITVIFGLYGYDWTIDNEGRSKASAWSLSYNEIKMKFLQDCILDNCVIKQDKVSSEMKITYMDNNKNNHVVWFEDMESVLAKQKYLKRTGISSFGFWAYSYF